MLYFAEILYGWYRQFCQKKKVLTYKYMHIYYLFIVTKLHHSKTHRELLNLIYFYLHYISILLYIQVVQHPLCSQSRRLNLLESH